MKIEIQLCINVEEAANALEVLAHLLRHAAATEATTKRLEQLLAEVTEEAAKSPWEEFKKFPPK